MKSHRETCTYPEHIPTSVPPSGNWSWECPSCGEKTRGEALRKLSGILAAMRRNFIEECVTTVEEIRKGAKVLPRELVVSRIRSLAQTAEASEATEKCQSPTGRCTNSNACQADDHCMYRETP